jgi:EpsI family protein
MASLAMLRSRATGIVVLMLAAALAFWPSSAELITFWTDLQNRGGTHGFLLLAVSIWMIYDRRDAIGSTPVRGSVLALGALVLGSILWVLLWRAGIEDPHILLLPFLVWLAVCAAYGFGVGRLLILPLGLLVLALPAWGHLVVVLQPLTVFAVGMLCGITGLPVYIEGDYIHIRSGVFEVAGGCAGVHLFVVALATGFLKVWLDNLSIRRGAIVVASLGAMALVSNWIRVYTIVVAGYATDMRHYLITVDHYWFGWGLFTVMLVATLWLLSRFLPPRPLPARVAALTLSRAPVRPYFTALSGIVAAPVIAYALLASRPAASAEARVVSPHSVAGWAGPLPVAGTAWQPVFNGSSSTRQELYRDSSGTEVELLVVVYREQHPGAELVTEGNSLLGPHLTASDSSIQTWEGGQVRASIAVQANGDRSLVWSWYGVGDRVLVNPFFTQIWYGLASTVGRPAAYLVAVRTRCEESCESSAARLARFLQAARQQPGSNAT